MHIALQLTQTSRAGGLIKSSCPSVPSLVAQPSTFHERSAQAKSSAVVEMVSCMESNFVRPFASLPLSHVTPDLQHSQCRYKVSSYPKNTNPVPWYRCPSPHRGPIDPYIARLRIMLRWHWRPVRRRRTYMYITRVIWVSALLRNDHTRIQTSYSSAQRSRRAMEIDRWSITRSVCVTSTCDNCLRRACPTAWCRDI